MVLPKLATVASGIVRSALSYILTDDSTFTGTSERSKTSFGQIATLLDMIAKEEYYDSFDEFSSQLLTYLQSLLIQLLTSWVV